MKTVVIQNESGLHARPCSHIANLVRNVAGDVFLIKDGKPFNAKSIMSLMGMGVTKGTTLDIECADPAIEEALYQFLADLKE